MLKPQDLKSLSLANLVALYNQQTGQNIKTFASKKVAIERCTAALKGEVEGKPSTKATEVKSRGKAVGGTRPVNLFYPISKELHPPREDSRRAKAVELLRKGTTLADIMKACKWNRAQAIQAIRLIHHKCGYGVVPGKAGDELLLVEQVAA